MSAETKTAVITGVSSGIGRAAAKSLIDAGWRVFGSVRTEKDARDANAALGANFTALIFDVTDGESIRVGAALVEKALDGRTLGGLVNNAGIAVAGPVALLPLKEMERQLDINLYGPLRVIQAFAPMLGADKRFAGPPGRIVNMSSVAGKIALPFMSPYAVSKHALEALSESLRREMMMHGVDVIIIGPGSVRTPIWGKADDLDITPYENSVYTPYLERLRASMKEVGEAGLEPEAIGDLVRMALTSKKPKTRYAILKSKLALWTLPKILPRRFVDKLVAKRFGIEIRD